MSSFVFAHANLTKNGTPRDSGADVPQATDEPRASFVYADIAFASTGSSAATAISPATAAHPTGIVTGAANPTAAPSWINTLATASIAADMTAADVGGTVTYSGLEKLLADLDSSLKSSNTTLTAAEFSDLKTIAANLENGMTTSAYLSGIMNSLVDGNAANAAWTGGAASSTKLGNLVVGASATTLSELNGKWFLGTDLPSSNVVMTGTAPFSVTYSASASPLFGAGGPSMNDINQGDLGDCFFLSCLAEVAYKNSSDISSMFTSNGNNTYGVRFYVDGAAEYVTVDNFLADGGREFNYGANIWGSLAETAFTEAEASGILTGNPSVNYGNSFSTIGNGGDPANALEAITGASAITEFWVSGASWSTEVMNSSMNETSYSAASSTATILGILSADLTKGDDADLDSNTNAKDSSGKITLVADHAMSIYGYDSSTGMFEIRNPWGAESGQTWDTTFEVSLTTLMADDDSIAVDNVGTGGSIVAAAPVLKLQTGTQTWKLGQAVSFALPSSTFTDPQAEKLTYSATLSTGAALPTWLSFNAPTETFTGTVPNTTAGLSLKVTATDTSGLSASETFSVLTPGSAPILAHQTAAQTWTSGKAVSFVVPANAFTDPQGEKLTYSATLASGAALPSWLKFSSATDSFTGTAPATAQALSLKLTATDTSGLSASETFAASVTAAAAHFAAAYMLSGPGASSATASLSSLVSEAGVPTLAPPAH